MRRAITTLREARDKGVREQVEAMRRSDTFEEVGTFASFSCQSDSLRLQPWQTAPLWVGDLAAALRKPFGDQRGDREAAEILQKLLANGLSRFEPDPLAALERASQK